MGDVYARYVKEGDRFELGKEYDGVFVPFATVDGVQVRTTITAGKNAATNAAEAQTVAPAGDEADHGESGTGAAQ